MASSVYLQLKVSSATGSDESLCSVCAVHSKMASGLELPATLPTSAFPNLIFRLADQPLSRSGTAPDRMDENVRVSGWVSDQADTRDYENPSWRLCAAESRAPQRRAIRPSLISNHSIANSS